MSAYPLTMLNQQLDYARYHSRFYSRQLSGYALPLASCESLSALPFTEVEDLQNHGAEMLCVGADKVERIVTLNSSGSGGAPKRLFFTRRDLARTVEFFSTGMNAMCGAGDGVSIFMPANAENSIARLLAEGLEYFGAQPYVFGLIQDYPKAVEALYQVKPHTIVGVPSQMRKLALLTPALRPQNILLTADYIADAAKKTITKMWHCAIFEHYGLTESGYGGAVECPAHDGMHIRHDELVLEVIEPNGTRPVAEGQWGEIVLTTLRREAMPLIRYRTGDMGRLIRRPCACGSELPRLDRIRGRLSEIAREVNIYHVDEILYAINEVLDYSASCKEGILTITLETVNAGCSDYCKARLAQTWPDLSIRVIPVPATAAGVTPTATKAERNRKRTIDWRV